MRMILCGTAHESWSTDIDEFNTRVAIKRIQVHDNKTDWRDVVSLKISDMRCVVEVGQYAGVHSRMQCHHTVSEHCWVTREVGDVSDSETGVVQNFCRTTT